MTDLPPSQAHRPPIHALEWEHEALRCQKRIAELEAERDRLKEVLHAVTLCHDCPVCQHAAREALNKADTKLTEAKPLTVQGLRNRKSLWPDEVPPMPADLLPDEKWHHVTFTRDEEGKEAWYVDGKLMEAVNQKADTK